MFFSLVNLIHLPLNAVGLPCNHDATSDLIVLCVVLTQISSVCRTILAYFEDKVDKSIGGKDDCCDICRNRFVT